MFDRGETGRVRRTPGTSRCSMVDLKGEDQPAFPLSTYLLVPRRHVLEPIDMDNLVVPRLLGVAGVVDCLIPIHTWGGG